MSHPAVDNQTPFAFAPLFVADEDGRPIVATIVKGTFDVSAMGRVTLAEEQTEVDFKGKHYGDPAESSYRLEPETAFVKLATDCVLLGHAIAPREVTQMSVSFRIGPLSKTARVSGDRVFEQGLLGARVSKPAPFQMLPLVYERAFGGWDRSSEKESHHDCEPRNPVGMGFAAKHGKFVPGAPVPNIEDARQPLTSYRGRCTPVGFGFIGAQWHPRAKFAGTYDEAWTKHRSPLLPKDFSRRFFQAAPDDLVAPGYLAGDEAVAVTGATPEGNWQFRLPGIHPPRCTVATRFGGDRELVTNLDTVIVDADARRVVLLWRAFTTLRSGPHDVRAMQVTCANAHRSGLHGAPVAAAVSDFPF